MLSWLRRASQAAPVLALAERGTAADLQALAAGLGGRLEAADSLEGLLAHPAFRSAELVLLGTGHHAAAVAAARTGLGGEVAVLAEDPLEQIGLRDLDAGLRGVRVRPVSRAAAMARFLFAGAALPDRVLCRGEAHLLILGAAGPVPAQLLLAALRLLQLPGVAARVTLAGPGTTAMVARLRTALPELDRTGTVTAAEEADPSTRPTLALASDGAPPWPGPVIRVALPSWEEAGQHLRDVQADRVPRAIHAMHLEERAAAGGRIGDQPSQVPWDELPERFREAARHNASHIPFKLRWAGARVTAAADDPFGWTSSELLALSEAEHRRWAAVARLEGWTFGAVRDDTAKRTPMLVEFAALSQEVQDLDALPVRAAIGHLGQPVQRDVLIALQPGGDTPAPGFERAFAQALRHLVEQQGKRPVVLLFDRDTALVQAAAKVAGEAGMPMQLAAMDEPGAGLAARMERIVVGGASPPCSSIKMRLEPGGQVSAC